MKSAVATAADTEERIRVGTRADGSFHEIPIDGVHNFNTGLLGETGSGKTHLMRKLIAGYARAGVTPIIFDVHHDIAVDPDSGESLLPGVSADRIHRVQFAYDGSGGTINPLRVSPYDGPYVIAAHFIGAVRLFAPSFGRRQVSLLDRMLAELYATFGIYKDQPDTWDRSSPTLQDLLRLGESWRMAAELGAGDVDAAKKVSKAIKRHKEALGSEDENKQAAAHAEIGREVCEALSEVGGDIDISRLDSVLELLQDLDRTQLFGPDSLSITPGVVNVFDLYGINRSHSEMIAYMLSDRVFQYARRTAKNLEPQRPRLLLVIDEGKMVKRISEPLMSPISQISTEGRKFGLGMIYGAQDEGHLIGDMINSSACFFVLHQHRRKVDAVARRFKIPSEQVGRLVARQDALAYLNHGTFQPIHVLA